MKSSPIPFTLTCIPTRCRRSVTSGRLATLFLSLGLASTPLHAQNSPSNPAADMWGDPAFVRAFTGSYGFLSDYEPAISDEEKVALRSLIELIQASRPLAIQQLESQIVADTSAAFDFILANLHFQEGNLARAADAYGAAIAKHPNFRRAYKNLGLVQVQAGRYEEAISALSRAIELGEADGRSYGLLGYSHLMEQHYMPAKIAYRQAILMQPDVIDWQVGLARCLLETGAYADAIALLETLLQNDPDNSDYWLLQSNAFIAHGDSLRAAKNLEIVRRMGEADLSTLTLLGDIYMKNQTPDLALDAYLSAINLAGPDTTTALLNAAELLTRTGNHARAQRLAEEIRARLTPLSHEEELSLLVIEAKIARATGDSESAIHTLQTIIERDALNGEAILELANYFADQGELAQATIRYEQAAKLPEYERPALIAHAQALVQDRNYDGALPLLRRALDLQADPNLEDYTRRVERAARHP